MWSQNTTFTKKGTRVPEETGHPRPEARILQDESEKSYSTKNKGS